MHQLRSLPRVRRRPVQRRLLLTPRRSRPLAADVLAAEVTIPLSEVWHHLSFQQQAQLRQTLLQTLQEVITHAKCR
jgi:hypothetical protein